MERSHQEMDVDEFVAEAHRIVEKLKRLDMRFQVFGAETHGYQFSEVLSEEQVAAFEHSHGITLPASYRAFITQLGNGGPGPYYGILPLDLHATTVGAQFPCTKAVTGIPELDDSSALPGSIQIADYGCAIFMVLVITGPGAGEVWCDARWEGGVQPVLDRGKKPLTFGRWWLQDMGAALQRYEQVADLMWKRTPHQEIHRLLDGKELSLDIDKTMASLMDVTLEGKPRRVGNNAWGHQCGLVDDRYEEWLKTHG